MNKKIIIAGGTGFIGVHLKKFFEKEGYKVFVISRNDPYVKWDDEEALNQALENCEILINLAGKSINCRHTKENKEKIIQSRTSTTKKLGKAILKCTHPPKLWINASGADIYREARDRPMTEENGEIGTDFLAKVSQQWEDAFFSFDLPETRQAALRFTIILGKDGGALQPMIQLSRLGLGGKQGDGNQMVSWIHIEDLFRIILFINSHPEMKGVFNCGSPNPVGNKTFMKDLREAMQVKIGLPAWSWMIKIGAIVIQTEPELILKSRWVLPERLLEAGFGFKYPDIKSTLKEIVGK